jgi:hypothetical protein
MQVEENEALSEIFEIVEATYSWVIRTQVSSLYRRRGMRR